MFDLANTILVDLWAVAVDTGVPRADITFDNCVTDCGIMSDQV
jgi:hypothetical protein